MNIEPPPLPFDGEPLPPLPVPSMEGGRARVEPKLIRIPPRLTHPRDILAISVLPGFAMILMAVALVVLDQPHAGSTAPSKIVTAAWWLGGFGAVLAGVIGTLAWTLNARRAAFFARCRDAAAEFGEGAAFARKWSEGGKRSPEEQLRIIATEYLTGRHPRAWIVCTGMVDVPPIENVSFEPIVISPSRLFWTYGAIASAAIMGLLAVMWLLPAFQSAPAYLDHPALLLLAVVIGGPIVFRWLWGAVIRPRYVRIAPGVFQILEYRWRRGAPRVTSIPIEAGTLVVVTNQLWSDLSISLMRDERIEAFPLSGIRNAAEIREIVWRALLTTVPTPPLSDADLVG
ncbi:MAG: hypothetical protein HZB38_03400 [Planctomycetes bacterium]|nr:hypothetical protein [Planctomycetota bacterium]